MKNRTAILIGSILIILGVFSIIDALLGINLWSLVFPLILISLGFLILFRPKTLPGGTNFILRFVGETNKSNEWTVEPAEYWSFVGSMKLDFSQAVIPEGETSIVMYSFVNDLEIILPTDAGLKLIARGFVHDTKVKGNKEDHIFAPFEYETPGYAQQTRKINIQSLSFVSEVEINDHGS
ncbi:MAG: cell wall-active antibiotics response protein [Anaerolineaceae bacterium]|nr:cell wall-active antibiotics response protein [Anaerolineaceae bacterium]